MDEVVSLEKREARKARLGERVGAAAAALLANRCRRRGIENIGWTDAARAASLLVRRANAVARAADATVTGFGGQGNVPGRVTSPNGALKKDSMPSKVVPAAMMVPSPGRPPSAGMPPKKPGGGPGYPDIEIPPLIGNWKTRYEGQTVIMGGYKFEVRHGVMVCLGETRVPPSTGGLGTAGGARPKNGDRWNNHGMMNKMFLEQLERLGINVDAARAAGVEKVRSGPDSTVYVLPPGARL